MTRILQRIGFASVWASVNPVLMLGEAGWERDTRKQKIGDGTTLWNDLPYVVSASGGGGGGTGAVSSVAGRIGDVVLTKTDVGLSNVDNTTDANKPVSTATQTALNAKAPLASPALTGSPTAPTAVAGASTTQIATTAFVTAAIAASSSGSYAPLNSPHLTGNPTAPTPGIGDDTTALATTAFVNAAIAAADSQDAVTSVNGLTGDVILTKASIGLSAVDNTSDANKPISTATQSALDAKAALASPALTGTPTAPTAVAGTNTTQIATTAYVRAAISALPTSPVTSVAGRTGAVVLAKADVGLSNVDNTSDASKPVSTATQSALNNKANFYHSHDAVDIVSGVLSDEVLPDRIGVSTTPLPSGSFDQALESGWFYASAEVDAPPTLGESFLVFVMRKEGLNGLTTQIAIQVSDDTASYPQGTMHYRSQQGGDWTPWQHAATGQDLTAAIDYVLFSPAFTGSPTAPSPAPSDNTTRLATTAFVRSAIATYSPGGGGTSGVTTVNGRTGTVVLTKADVALNSVDNTADADKPISAPQQTALDAKAPLASPSFSGVPLAPTPVQGTNSPQIATTAYVTAGLAIKAPLDSPALTGTPTAPTQVSGNSSTRLATTAFVAAAVAAIPAAPVTSVAGKTGAVTLVKADVGLGNVDNTADAAKPVSTATQSALDAKAALASPALTGTPTAPTAAAATSTTQIATTAFVTAAVAAVPAAPVSSVAGRTGAVVLAKADVGLGNVDNTSDANKPISTAEAAALALKAPLASPALTGTPTAPTAAAATNTTQVATTAFVTAAVAAVPAAPVTSVAGRTGVVTLAKADVGLGSVDNTSDASKPVSTAQQSALDAKAPLASPALTGTPTAPTAAGGTNTTQVATTAFVAAAGYQTAQTYHAARQSTSTASFANNAENVVLFDVADSLDGFTYNAATGAFTVPAKGRYLVSATVTWAAAAATQGFRSARIRVNGTTIRLNNSGATAAIVGATIAEPLKLAAGDTIQITGVQASGGALSLVGVNTAIYIDISYLGPSV